MSLKDFEFTCLQEHDLWREEATTKLEMSSTRLDGELFGHNE